MDSDNPMTASRPQRGRLGQLLVADDLPEDAASPAFWLAFLMAAVSLAFKAPDSLTLPQFWAEDAQTFFAEQRVQAWPPLFRAYANYLLFVPRVGAWLASLLPTLYAPRVYSLFAWIVGALSLVSLRQLRIASAPYWLWLAGIVLVPTNGEIFGALTNVQWLTQLYFLGLLARLMRSDSSASSWLRVLITLAVGLSGPFSVFAALMGVGLVGLSRLEATWKLDASPVRWSGELTALCTAAVAQSICLVGSDPSAANVVTPWSFPGALEVLLYTQPHMLASTPLPPWLFCMLVLSILIAPLLWVRLRSERLFLLACYGYVALLALAAARKFSGQSVLLAAMQNGDRYFVMSKTLLFWALALTLWRVAQARPALGRPLLLLLLLAPLPYSWPYLQRPALPDRNWPQAAALIDAQPEALVDIAPGWRVLIKSKPASK